HPQPRLPGRAGSGAGGLRHLRVQQPARRCPLYRHRPAHPVRQVTQQTLIDTVEVVPRRRTSWAQFRGTLWRYKKARIGLVLLSIFVVAAIFGPLISPYDANNMAFDMLSPPSWAHPLGTDDLGRDLLSRIIVGTQVSLFVGVSTVAIALVIGVTL